MPKTQEAPQQDCSEPQQQQQQQQGRSEQCTAAAADSTSSDVVDAVVVVFVYSEATRHNIIPKDVTHVHIDPSVTEIHDGAFSSFKVDPIYYCRGEGRQGRRIGTDWKSLLWRMYHVGKDGNTMDEGRGQLTTIGASAFYKCSSLIHVRVPSTVKVPEHFSSSKDDENQHDDGCCFDPYELLFFGCTSLVNLAMPRPKVSTSSTTIPRTTTPPIIIVNDRNEDFLGQLQFRHVADTMDNLMNKLQHRFDSCPVHKLCYYQSYYDEVEQRLKEILNDSSISSSCQQVDGFGMTPFHILALSQTPNLFLFKAILKHYTTTMQEHTTAPPDLIGMKDAFGKTPLDYLAYNNNEAAATEMIRIIINQRLKFLGLNQWKMDIQTIMNQALCTTPTDVVQTTTRPIALLRYKLAIYERKEIISLIELTLWDMQLNEATKKEQQYPTFQQQQQEEEENKSVSSTMFRHNCRINCGLDIVISRVLPFLSPITVEDFTV
eukprot:scaffold22615_cov97-Cylindrotheca_fusiformis.AAC.7